MEELHGGSLGQFADSMAEEMENALDEVRIEAGLLPLPNPAHPKDLENRRILFSAIARGVVRHLQKKNEAFEITVKVPPHPSVTTYPAVQVKP